jgi:hypothetical protein
MTRDNYEDPKKRDPRFPDRPTHPDFVALSETVQEMDRLAEVDRVPIPDMVGADMESLTYLIRNRLGVIAQKTGRRIDTDDLFLLSLYLDAFTLGKRFAKREGH